MSDSVETLHALMRQFVALRYGVISFGPKHPEIPNPALQGVVDAFVADHPYLTHDQGYIDFLEGYFGATIFWPGPEYKLWLTIYGFTPTTEYLPDPVNIALLTDDGNHYRFAEVHLRPEPRQQIDLSFAFAINPNERKGVYRQMKTHWKEDPPYYWYCDTFLQWLLLVIDKEGMLTE